MKRSFIIIFAGLLGLVLTACQDAVQQVAGTYSYKISGRATVDGDEVKLSDEVGAMELIRIDSTTAMVTFNALSGPAYTTQAEIHADQITLNTYERDLTVNLTDYHLSASGSGTIYDQTILITLQYKGDKFSADQLTMLCKKN